MKYGTIKHVRKRYDAAQCHLTLRGTIQHDAIQHDITMQHAILYMIHNM